MAYTTMKKSLIEDLKLSHAPVGIAFLKEAPKGVRRYGEAVPAACAFWRAAQTSLFYATAEDHYNCPIGALTQGFQPPQEVVDQAMLLVAQMGKLKYLDASEVANLPMMASGHEFVLYGPLDQFESVKPDVVLVICTPYHAMLLSEATGIMTWSGAARASILGRPACAVIPTAVKGGSATLSLACMGARTFAGIAEQELILAIPATSLGEFEQRLATIAEANRCMKTYYDDKQSNYARA